METRILWQAENRANDADFEGVTETYAAMLKFAHQVARPDTEITLRYMDEAPRSFANNLIYPRAVTKVQVVNRVVMPSGKDSMRHWPASASSTRIRRSAVRRSGCRYWAERNRRC
ncbi:hypothetical protein [Burkholderia sp. LA-2-3-30-S1-D2]|uniref:hypothetical protein n=1 Tax=Burkholderia sp. LA-2-3-30-S1-D2 TaxID=1637862 RepID=UPI00075ECFD5|nr:hypothetical protein [Burkholderia sp. LA-2-3-30-S1-D2]AOI99905.1 hypothetical protein WS66_29800 [Burkholderia sp. LA-2-3-30-S1-D2]KVE16724.1 hypothetical protein WS66_06025 [Burkholderia sp. LA-2-3-30-S1-D2]